MFQKAVGSDNVNATLLNFMLGGHAFDAAEVIYVRMSVDDGFHRPCLGRLSRFAMLSIELQSRSACLLRSERVNDDRTLVALDESGVGKVKAAHLGYVRCHFEEDIETGEPRLPPETVGYREWCLLVAEEVLRIAVLCDLALGVLDHVSLEVTC